MPEGDTVLRTARRLHEALAGRKLERAELRWAELGGVDLAGRTVLEVVAYGKHILLRLAAGEGAGGRIATAPTWPLTLRSHLRMDGSWFVYASGARRWPSIDNPSVRAVLQGEEWTAVGDLLGMLDLVATEDESTLIGHLGPDILADDFLEVGLSRAVERLAAGPDRPIGQALLEQTGVAGIGTFYMAESLFAGRISPWVPVGEVDLAPLLQVARKQLLRGVLLPAPNTTGDPRRGQGSYVHARSGRPCRRCGDTVRVASVGVAPTERPAFYCPTCQPGPTPTDSGRPARPLGSTPHRFGSRRNEGLKQRPGNR